MEGSPVVGHSEIHSRFDHWIRTGRLANTYLLVGPEGIGKLGMAMWVAKCLLCEGDTESGLTACNVCPACQQVDAGTHPDVLTVDKPGDKNYIPIELLIGSREKRMREGLCHDIAMKPFRGGRRIALINDADFLNQEGANCLLKTLEEPPASAVIFLIASSEHRQLPTIRSRSQIVRFQPLDAADVGSILQNKQLLQEGISVGELALASEGSLKFAMQLSDPEILEFRRGWLEQLATLDPGAQAFHENINSFVDGAGKESAAKRARLRLVADIAATFYRHVMVALCGQALSVDETMFVNVKNAMERWSNDANVAAGCIERCESLKGHVTANANQSLVVETFLSDLGRIIRKEILK